MPERLAIVLAHPGHEVFLAGMIQRYRPSMLYITNADSAGETDREEQTLEGLRELGVPCNPKFLGTSEKRSYEWAFAGEPGPYLDIIDRIEGWLETERPTRVIGDAFELSNFHHDLGRVLLDRAVARVRASGHAIDNYEFPIVCRTGPELKDFRIHQFPGGDFETFRLDPAEVQRKKKMFDWAAQRYADAAQAPGMIPPLDREHYRKVPADRDYTVPPPGLRKHYDDWGRAQVAAGKYETPILFDDRFVPLVEKLG